MSVLEFIIFYLSTYFYFIFICINAYKKKKAEAETFETKGRVGPCVSFLSPIIVSPIIVSQIIVSQIIVSPINPFIIPLQSKINGYVQEIQYLPIPECFRNSNTGTIKI